MLNNWVVYCILATALSFTPLLLILGDFVSLSQAIEKIFTLELLMSIYDVVLVRVIISKKQIDQEYLGS